MSSLNELFNLMREAKANDPEQKIIKEVKENIQSDLSGLFTQMNTIRTEDPVYQKNKKLEENVQRNIQSDLSLLFSELATLEQHKQKLVEENPSLLEETPIPTPVGVTPVELQIPNIDKYVSSPVEVSPPVDPLSKQFKTVNDKIKFLEQWISKIQNAGPGGGEVNLRYLDDVARETIADGRWLKYDASRKKFVFDDINPYEVVENTTEVTTPTYTVQDNDFYIGVNYAGPVTITLPVSANSGRLLIIKDEDGDAETNPITVVGNVDNDAGGFIIQINNGGVQLLYRNGWRIV